MNRVTNKEKIATAVHYHDYNSNDNPSAAAVATGWCLYHDKTTVPDD